MQVMVVTTRISCSALLRLTVSPLTMFHRFKGSGSFLFIPFMNLSRFADSVHGLQDMALLSVLRCYLAKARVM